MEGIEKWVNSLGKEKLIILVIGFVILAIIIFVLTMQSNNQSSEILAPTPSISLKQQNGKINNDNLQQPIGVSATVTPKIGDQNTSESNNGGVPEWKNYDASGYTIDIPPDWSAQSRQTIDGGEMLVIRPNILAEGVNSPQLIIYLGLDESDMQQKIGLLNGLGFTESKVEVMGKSALKFSGTLSSKTVGDQRVNQPIQVTDLYLTQGERLYVFSYQYDGEAPTKILDDYFISIIDSMKLK